MNTTVVALVPVTVYGRLPARYFQAIRFLPIGVFLLSPAGARSEVSHVQERQLRARPATEIAAYA